MPGGILLQHTNAHARRHTHTPHIHGWQEAKAGRCCPNGGLFLKSTSAREQVVLTEIVWQLRHMAGSRQELQ